MSDRVILLGVTALGIAAIFGSIALSRFQCVPFPTEQGVISQADLPKWEPVLGMKFPPSAVLVSGSWTRALDSDARLCIRLNRADAPALIASAPFVAEAPRTSDSRFPVDSADPLATEHQSANTFREWEINFRPSEWLKCKIIDNGGETVTVFLVWHTV